MVKGVWEGISSMSSWLSSSATGFFQGIVGGITNFLGIHSPSVLFRDKIGKNIALGVKAGIDDEMPNVLNNTIRHMKMLTNSIEIENGKRNAGDLIAMANSSNMFDIGNTLQANNVLTEQQSKIITENQPSINLTVEPLGDMRGFFEYLRVGIDREKYLSGGKIET
jgi:phage-related protein